MQRRWWLEAVVFCLLIALGVASRLTKDVLPYNIHAVTACALLAGFFFRSRVVALAVPLAAMSISDARLGGYDAPVMAAVYVATALPLMCRGFLRRKPVAGRVVISSLACSLAYFVLTNAAYWYAMYPRHTVATLAECFAQAVPFFRYAAAGDLFFAGVLFGAYALAVRWHAAWSASAIAEA